MSNFNNLFVFHNISTCRPNKSRHISGTMAAAQQLPAPAQMGAEVPKCRGIAIKYALTRVFDDEAAMKLFYNVNYLTEHNLHWSTKTVGTYKATQKLKCRYNSVLLPEHHVAFLMISPNICIFF